MKKIVSRFGEIEYDPQNTLFFPDGLIGFESLREFVVMPNKKAGPLFWIQSIEDPQIAFVLTDPTNFFLEYRIEPDTIEAEKLQLQDGEVCHNLSIVTVHQDKSISLNLQAPILYAPGSNRALQVILEKSQYEPQTRLPEQ